MGLRIRVANRWKDSDSSVKSIHLDKVAIFDEFGSDIGADNAGFFELATDNGGVAEDTTLVGDDSSSPGHKGDKIWCGHIANKNFSRIKLNTIYFF